MTRVIHLSSVHRRYDTRVFLKESRSLAAAGFEVFLVVADGKPDEVRDGVSIVSVGAPSSRAKRMLTTTWRVAQKGLELDGDIYHLHDPELLPLALWLKSRGKAVLYDAHEDLPEQVKGHSYLPKWSRSTVAAAAGFVVKHVCRRLDGVVAATPYIQDQFRAMGVRSEDVSNFPILGELEVEQNWTAKRRQVCYVGTIAAVRGVLDIVKAMQFVQGDVRLVLGGELVGSDVESDVVREAGWARVDALGFLDRPCTRETLAQSVAGLVTLHPNGNYINAQPVKMFEYMAAGIPVIASDFPLWRRIVEDAGCGRLVDPLNPAAIGAAIDWFIDNAEAARAMGENGRKAVLERYNWDVEKRKLFGFYDTVLGSKGQA
ncbi:glycosyltransferase family 4 protein [Mesorhizobium sp. A623]